MQDYFLLKQFLLQLRLGLENTRPPIFRSSQSPKQVPICNILVGQHLRHPSGPRRTAKIFHGEKKYHDDGKVRQNLTLTAMPRIQKNQIIQISVLPTKQLQLLIQGNLFPEIVFEDFFYLVKVEFEEQKYIIEFQIFQSC